MPGPEAEIEERQRILHFRANRHWDTFLALIEILRFFGCLAGDEGLDPTEIGRTVAALRGDNELWLGLALMSVGSVLTLKSLSMRSSA